MRSFDSSKGFSVVELLVTIFLGLLIMALAVSSILVHRDIMGKDTVRTRLNENLRGALDIIGTEVRVAGENLGSAFPAIEFTNGTGSNPDLLYLRRNLLDEILPLCQAITQGTSTTSIVFAIPGSTPAGCVYSGQTHNYNAWRTYRTGHSGTVDAYIFDTSTKRGEFFKYTTERDTGTSYYLTKSAGTWANSYAIASSAVYILEEWQYRMSSDMLQVVQNRDTTNALTAAFGLTNFQVQALMQDGTTKTAFTPTDAWSRIIELQVDLTGQERFRGQNFSKTVSAQFFPRNILSF